MSNDVALSFLQKNGQLYRVNVPWSGNGFLVAGKSGSGKGHTMAFLLTQYVIKGVEIVLCDYSSSISSEETLIERTKHLEGGISHVAITEKEIVATMNYLFELNTARKRGEAEQTPVIFVFDEFTQFAGTYTEPKITRSRREKIDDNWTESESVTDKGLIDRFIANITDIRKQNIKVIIAGQEWSEKNTTAGMRAVRSQITSGIYHQLDEVNAKMLGFNSKEEQRSVMKLNAGEVIYNNRKYRVPYNTAEQPIRKDLVDAAIRSIDERRGNNKITLPKNKPAAVIQEKVAYKLTELDTVLLQEMITKYGAKIGRVETKDDVIRWLVSRNWSNNRILEVIKGDRTQLNTKINEIKVEMKID